MKGLELQASQEERDSLISQLLAFVNQQQLMPSPSILCHLPTLLIRAFKPNCSGLAQQTLKELENAWINEKFAPEILPHREDLIDPMMDCISDMERNLKELKKGDLRITIHTMELNRIRFLISSYLRTRLEKIENNVIQILTQENDKIDNNSDDLYLTAGELKFAQDYLMNFETLFQTVALKHMPDKFQEFEYKKFSVKPNLQTHVFLRANKNISGIIIPETVEDQVDFETGSQHIIQYAAVAKFVKSGDVQLI